ncbi:hypothetical protein [Streptomyces atratus]|uniref:hypothetical protein n=1 Tax=Streptomyces atratus TaxID=1893 RepID=UPI0033DA1A12
MRGVLAEPADVLGQVRRDVGEVLRGDLSGRIHVLGTTAHPTAGWVTHTVKNLATDLEDVGAHAAYLIHDRNTKYPALIDEILTAAPIQSVFTGVRMPRMNPITERWVLSPRRELLDRTPIWNAHHVRHAPREHEQFYNEHRTHRSLQAAAQLRALPETITDPRQIALSRTEATSPGGRTTRPSCADSAAPAAGRGAARRGSGDGPASAVGAAGGDGPRPESP